MGPEAYDKLWKLIGLRYASHPWHGIEIGSRAPEILTSFIEVIPSDTVKYEIDKKSGYLKIDRPQKFSNIVPALYGFVPQTYCMDHVAEYCMEQTGRKNIVGDGDPLDICVLTEREVTHGNIIVKARPIGGFRMLDGGEADDKIIAVLENDEVYDTWRDVKDLPKSILDRLQHYFLTYKQLPGEEPKCEITDIYGAEEAKAVIQASREDYHEHYGNLEDVMSTTLMEAMSFGQRRDRVLDGL
ncbi:inorganic pyrophosphatase [Lewinella sp. 4G2]|uniref:inorganic pyrophosphatase n=1 Tax=Lewinella sp. 4G2 TaxID=1803372 RepID=UPI0007B45CE7|nr:inorganic pyrophosphatase [Lewinella sp. 4G2]OAV44194.1 inorganic pyrophosphatase [Lewinella sp. 4G2]